MDNLKIQITYYYLKIVCKVCDEVYLVTVSNNIYQMVLSKATYSNSYSHTLRLPCKVPTSTSGALQPAESNQ